MNDGRNAWCFSSLTDHASATPLGHLEHRPKPRGLGLNCGKIHPHRRPSHLEDCLLKVTSQPVVKSCERPLSKYNPPPAVAQTADSTSFHRSFHSCLRISRPNSQAETTSAKVWQHGEGERRDCCSSNRETQIYLKSPTICSANEPVGLLLHLKSHNHLHHLRDV